MKCSRTLFSSLCAIVFAIALVSAERACASVIDSSGAGFSIPDNNAGGDSSTISIGVDETISDIEVTLFGLTHSWVGDLVGTITSPSGTSAELFFRVGNGNFGDSSNLNGDYTFGDSGSSWASAVGSVGGNGTVPVGTYQASTDGDGPISLAAAFTGESTLGDWTLNLSDNARFDTGSLGGWGLNITSSVTAVPEPGPMFLVCLAAGVSMRRPSRRRRNA